MRRIAFYVLTDDGFAPEIGIPQFADRSGRIYTSTSNPYPQVRRYRMIIEE